MESRPGPGNVGGMNNLLREEFHKRLFSPDKEESVRKKFKRICLSFAWYKMQ